MSIRCDEVAIVPSLKSRPPPPPSVWTSLNGFGRILFCIKVALRAIWCICSIIVMFTAYFGFIAPISLTKKAWPRLFWGWEGQLYRWMQAFTGYWGYMAGYDVYEYGDDITEHGKNDRVLMMINHQSTVDVPVLMALLQNKGAASRKTLWLMDVMFRWTPFGIISKNHGDYFIRQGKATREKELEKLKKHLRRVFWDRDRRWVILFPEGGFYYNRFESSQAYARKNNFPHLEHTTLPRQGAMKVILDTIGPRDEDSTLVKSRSGPFELIKETVGAIRDKKYVKETRPPIKYILDVTIAYPGGHPLGIDTLTLGTRERCDIGVNYKIYKAEDVPFEDDEKLRDWLYDRYVEKDKILDTYYRLGVFHEGEEGTRIHFPKLKIFSQYAFWIGCFYIQYLIYRWFLMQIIYTLANLWTFR